MAKELHSGKAGTPARQATTQHRPAARTRTKAPVNKSATEDTPPPRRVMKRAHSQPCSPMCGTR
uniref:hypothetical protein n=1 Tax=Acetobacter okinawensis TaxID=1076594 RepID=UPI0011DCDDCC